MPSALHAQAHLCLATTLRGTYYLHSIGRRLRSKEFKVMMAKSILLPKLCSNGSYKHKPYSESRKDGGKEVTLRQWRGEGLQEHFRTEITPWLGPLATDPRQLCAISAVGLDARASPLGSLTPHVSIYFSVNHCIHREVLLLLLLQVIETQPRLGKAKE